LRLELSGSVEFSEIAFLPM
jgi:hypothetical protein